MIEIVGRRGDLVLFASEGMSALVDEAQNMVVSIGETDALLASVNPLVGDETATDSASMLAEAALTGLDIEVFSNSDRMHTIPKSVQAEAKRALEWRAKYDRGGTPVGLNTARTLAQGGQIGIRKIRHIAKYFPRHEVDKKGKGYKPGDDGYPSKGRIAWGLWGGDAAQRWASAIVERENKKAKNASLIADGFFDIDRPEQAMLSDFAKPNVQFAARVRKDGTGIDRIYRVDAFGNVAVWDDGAWDDLGHVDSDINTLDRSLDDPYDTTEKMVVPIDAESALAIAAMMDSNPFEPKMLSSIDAEESDLFDEAESAIDWDEIDGLCAAAPPEDGYTPEERSENVESQIRDGKGRFAEKGGRVIINGNPNDRGVIESIDPVKKTATVKLDSGVTVEVPVNKTESEEGAPPPPPDVPSDMKPLDTDGILKQPNMEKKPENLARLSKKLPVIGKEELHEMLADFPSMVEKKREKARREGLTAAANGEVENAYKEPKESDVAPIYMALVADDDPQAVLDLIALVPAGPTSNSPSVFKRSPGKWEKADDILQDLNSPTPPPVVKLDQTMLEEVITQVDSAVVAALVSAGGADRNRGGAEKLRRYWLYGKGAAKIRWNTPGDWTRCTRLLAKYMGPRAKGYCALRHKEATGMWTGDKPHRQTFAISAGGVQTYSDDYLLSTEEIIAKSVTKARIADAKRRVLTAGGAVKPADGGKFIIPLVIPEGMESGDGRIFDKGAITMRELPLPLLWQIKTADGHAGSVVVGRIDHMERVEDGIGNARGVFDKGEYGKEAERLVRGGFIRGVSADLDQFEADEEVPDTGADDEDGKIGQSRIKIRKARVMAVTLVPKPAFQECTIQLEDSNEQQEDEVVPDGVYVEGMDPLEASALVACGMIAGAIPNEPPAEWFENPKLKQATPLTVDESGRVFGHIAAWHVDHIGMAFGTKPPRSRSKYAYFHTGVIRTLEGTDVPVGQLTLAGGHASLEMSAQQAVRHYDDTASAFADVHAGEDAYGIWVAGALRPGTTPEQIRAIRASAPSGDWRPIKGHLELVAVCQVNVPGFPIARARVASGAVMALVAAGAQQLAHMKSDPISEMNERLARLEQPLVAAAEDARARVLAVKAQELAAKVHKTKDQIIEDDISWMTRTFDDGEPDSEAAIVSRRVRKRLAQEGKALPDGSFPIRNISDLKNAIHAYGRAGAGKKALVKKHIMRRARGLDRPDLIPENWLPKTEAAVDEFKYFSPEEREDLAKEGKALPDGSFPIENDRDLKNAIWAYGRAPQSKRAEVRAHIEKRAKELGKEDMLPEIWEGEGSSFSGDDADPLVASLRDRVAIVEAMVSAGGVDRNRGNAEKLRRYWTRGEGAAKIRWGTPGDWKRCVRHLAKYMGPRAKGYCQLRHKEATGIYTGSRFNPGRENSQIDPNSGALFSESPVIMTEVTEDDMNTPLEQILQESDDLFDGSWEPEEAIIILITEGADEDEDEAETEFAIEDEFPDLTPEEIEALKVERMQRAKDQKRDGKGKYTPGKDQPRDAAGKFRQVLARLKVDLGDAGLDRALEKVNEIENLDFSGDYSKASEASDDLIAIIERLDTKALNPESLENVRASAKELGEVISNLPFAFGEKAQKIRFSDMPPALRDLVEDMIKRVEKKIGPEDAAIATQELKKFMSGNEVYNQEEISGQMSKLLRLLT